uniref:Uncharacterized protein n=1 Tax=Anguilla anguilla TaxID=7936 RepID=A0A0E9U2B9_ANGAN
MRCSVQYHITDIF